MIRSTTAATRFRVRLATCVPPALLLAVAVLVCAATRAAAQSTLPVAVATPAAMVQTRDPQDAGVAEIRELRLALDATGDLTFDGDGGRTKRVAGRGRSTV